MSTTSPQENFHELLGSFSKAMLASQDGSGKLRSCPIILAGVDADSDVWRVTDKDSGKVDEISAYSEVNVALQGGGDFLSLSGQAEVVYDPAKVADL